MAEMKLVRLSFNMPPGSDTSSLQMTVGVTSRARLDLYVRRLNRIVGVHRVEVLPRSGAEDSVYLGLGSDETEFEHIARLVEWYDAEILSRSGNQVVVHLRAAASERAQFVSALRPFRTFWVSDVPPDRGISSPPDCLEAGHYRHRQL
ncbi:hypothetical protein [Gordonia terrae]